MTEEKEDTLLIPRDQYLAAGIHIGTQIKTQDMIPFIYRITRAGLYVIDIRQTDARMRIAAKFLSRFDPEKTIVVSARRYGHNPIQQFAHIIGGHAIPGRFVPGTLTNPNARSFLECDLLVIADPRADKQALQEAKIAKIPVISFCDTDNNLTSIDLCVPANNRGRKALALIFWLLTRQTLLEKGEIARVEDFNVDVNRYQSRSLITYEPSSDRQKILAQLKDEASEEVKKEPGEETAAEPEVIPEKVEEEKPQEKIEEEPPAEPIEKVEEEKPQEKVEEEPPAEPGEKVEAEVPEVKEPIEEKPTEEIPEKKAVEESEGDVIKPEDLIDGPLPEKKPKKAAKKKAKKKSAKKKTTKKKKEAASKVEEEKDEEKTESN